MLTEGCEVYGTVKNSVLQRMQEQFPDYAFFIVLDSDYSD